MSCDRLSRNGCAWGGESGAVAASDTASSGFRARHPHLDPMPLPKFEHDDAPPTEPTLIAAARSQMTASSPRGTFSQAELTADWAITRCITRQSAAAPRQRHRHYKTQYCTTRHETPCDRRHTEVLTKILTSRLGKTSGPYRTRRSPAIHDGVSEGTRTPDTQDHNLVL